VEKDKLKSDKLFQEKVESILNQILIENSNINNGKIFIGEPPSLSSKYLRRVRLLNEIMDSTFIGPTEVIGASGSGKTLLASQLVEYIKTINHDTAIFYIQVKNKFDFCDILSSIRLSITKFNNIDLVDVSDQRRLTYEETIKNTALLNFQAKPF
jgi:hypothetical protein